MATNKSPPEITQQVFLRDAMASLCMTRMEFAERISVPIKTLDKWLAPVSTSDFRNMPDVVWAYVREILDWTKKGLDSQVRAVSETSCAGERLKISANGEVRRSPNRNANR
ncbi:hypothetical protein [Burkholderia sp. A2]|uniref:hypothetical protein n=1 Tax=Burkholderia sp. A2 TaxID=236253 RepID=UPI00210C8639|nr:hypothetical protein [Burkholderia sp. A2]